MIDALDINGDGIIDARVSGGGTMFRSVTLETNAKDEVLQLPSVPQPINGHSP